MRIWLTGLLTLAVAAAGSVRADERPPVSAARATPTAAELEFFEKKIRPVLVAKCYECHSGQSKILRGGLLLDTRAGMQQGGDSGPAVVPGDIDASLLLAALRYETYEMPPDGKLPPSVIADFETWIRGGAADPRDGAPALPSRSPTLESGREYWAFQPLANPAVPPADGGGWAESDIDRLLLGRWQAAGLHPAADADRGTLLRRVYFDLSGLPPEPHDIEAFLEDGSPGALAAVVDRLLESPEFGERWGRHWLDVVRFAESSGGGRTKLFPTAWRFRDYVIESFQRDRPFDEFLMQHIAGDLMEAGSVEERQSQLVATAFLALGPTNYELQDKELLDWEVVDEQLDTLGRAFLGMTIGCARCHDHKFDPIPTRDYYALAGIFRSTQTLKHANVSNLVERELPLGPERQDALNAYRARTTPLEEELKRAEERLSVVTKELGGGRRSVAAKSLPGVVVDDSQARLTGTWKLSNSVPGYVGGGYQHASERSARARFEAPLSADGEYEVCIAYTAYSNRASKVAVVIEHAGGASTVWIDQRELPQREGLFQSVGRYRFDASRPAVVVLSCEQADGAVIADAVQFIPTSSLGETSSARTSGDQEADGGEGRLRQTLEAERKALKQEVGRLKGRLTALRRSAPPDPGEIMSVLEAEHCGDFPICIRGDAHKPGDIVPRGFLSVVGPEDAVEIPEGASGRLQLARWIVSPDNPLTPRVAVNRIWQHLFGVGLVPSVDNFGATGQPPSHPLLLDWLAARFVEQNWSTKRLIREIMLSHAYRMSCEDDPDCRDVDPDNRLVWRQNRRRLEAEALRDAMLVASGRLDRTHGGPSIPPGTTSEYGFEHSSLRRSVYLPVFRNTLPEIFEVFDGANPNLVSGRRNTSTLPTQALYFMNSSFVIEESRFAAQRLLMEAADAPARIELAYLRTLGRRPTADEAGLAAKYVRQEADTAEEAAWARFCQALFASVDFRFVN